MKNFFWICLVFAGLSSCNHRSEKGRFEVSGTLKNAPDQKIYIEELYFSQKDPEVLDTGFIKNGHFTIGATATEQGLYRIRLENDNGFIFINDQSKIPFTADLKDLSLSGTNFNTPANQLLKNFIVRVDTFKNSLDSKSIELHHAKEIKETDSLLNIKKAAMETETNNFTQYIIHYIDTTSNPVMALFALGYTRDLQPEKIQKSVNSLTARFPGNKSIGIIVQQFNQMLLKDATKPHIGSVAPNLFLPDTSGVLFSLQSLRGKFVLIDFWASWCGPCRGENPNVVKAYNQYKDKNFTVLGVSLDKDKGAWLNAIHADQLTWYHISDLKYWGSAAVGLYGLDSIPYNVLIDTQGKVIATGLRGDDLLNKLEEVLKK